MSFIFQMDQNDDQSQAGFGIGIGIHHKPPPASRLTNSRILVDYAPKYIQSPSPSPERGIKSWLDTHGSSYLPHDQPHPHPHPHPHPRRSSPPRARLGRSFQLSGGNSSTSGSDSDSDSETDLREEDAIFLQPRRHLSRQGSAMTSPVSKPAPAPAPAPATLKKFGAHHHLHLTAQRPALPVVDLSAASGHLQLDLESLPLDKSHWSDDEDEDEESDVAYSDTDSDDNDDADGLWALHPDELDVPALVDDDEGNPASSSTRSIPIPPAPTGGGSSRVGLMSRRLRPCFDVESPPTRRKSSDDQSFWTPWMDQYLADVAAVAHAAR